MSQTVKVLYTRWKHCLGSFRLVLYFVSRPLFECIDYPLIMFKLSLIMLCCTQCIANFFAQNFMPQFPCFAYKLGQIVAEAQTINPCLWNVIYRKYQPTLIKQSALELLTVLLEYFCARIYARILPTMLVLNAFIQVPYWYIWSIAIYMQ